MVLRGTFDNRVCIYRAQYTSENHYLKPSYSFECAFSPSLPQNPNPESDQQEMGFSLFKILHVIGYQSNELWAVAAQANVNPVAKFYSFPNCSESNFNLFVYGAL